MIGGDEIVAWAAENLEGVYPELGGNRDFGIVTRWPHTGYWPKSGYWQDVAALRKALPRRRVHVTSTLFVSGGVERAVLGGERTAARILKSGRHEPEQPNSIWGASYPVVSNLN